MKTSLLLLNLPILTANFLHAQTVEVTIEPAVEVKVETREGFRYEIDESESLSSPFESSGVSLEGTGETESALFPADDRRFFRAREIPTDLKTLIPGLTDFSLSTAQVGSEDNEVGIRGARVTSRDYDGDDFLSILYCFDFTRQSFIPKEFEVIEDLGPTLFRQNEFFPLDDTPGPPSATFAGDSFNPNTRVSLNVDGTGEDVIITTQPKQKISYLLSSNATFRLTISNSDGDEVGETVYSAGGGTLENSFDSLEGGVFTLRFQSLNEANFSTDFLYENANRSTVTNLSLATTFSTGTLTYANDYKKYLVTLQKDRELQLSGFSSGGYTAILSGLNGVALDGTTRVNGGSNSAILGPVDEDGDYYLIFLGSPFESNSFNGTLSYFN